MLFPADRGYRPFLLVITFSLITLGYYDSLAGLKRLDSEKRVSVSVYEEMLSCLFTGRKLDDFGE